MNVRDLIRPEYHFLICQKRCNECLYSRAKLTTEETAEKIKNRLADEGFFICHKATFRDDPFKACCRGFWDENKDTNQTLSTVQAFGALARARGTESQIWWINVETGELTPYNAEEADR